MLKKTIDTPATVKHDHLLPYIFNFNGLGLHCQGTN